MKNMVICGVGYISERVADGCIKASGMNLLGFQSRSLARAREATDIAGAQRAYGSYGAVLEDPEVDVVYLCTPNGVHYEMARRALEAGKSAIVEKPLAPSQREVLELFSLARSRGVLVMEAAKTCFSPLLEAVRNLVKAGEIGDLYQIDADYCYDMSHAGKGPDNWVFGHGGGCALDIGVYPAALAGMFASWRPSSVMAVRRSLEYPCDADVQSLVEFDGGLVARIGASWLRDVPEKGCATLYGTGGVISIPAYWKSRKAEVILADGGSRTLKVDFASDFAPEIEAAAHSLENGLSECPQMSEGMSLAILHFLGIDE